MHEDKWRIMDGTICADIFETEELAKVGLRNHIGDLQNEVERAHDALVEAEDALQDGRNACKIVAPENFGKQK
jgi:hypothetical protein